MTRQLVHNRQFSMRYSELGHLFGVVILLSFLAQPAYFYGCWRANRLQRCYCWRVQTCFYSNVSSLWTAGLENYRLELFCAGPRRSSRRETLSLYNYLTPPRRSRYAGLCLVVQFDLWRSYAPQPAGHSSFHSFWRCGWYWPGMEELRISLCLNWKVAAASLWLGSMSAGALAPP